VCAKELTEQRAERCPIRVSKFNQAATNEEREKEDGKTCHEILEEIG
jgi:hypothetical protein